MKHGFVVLFSVLVIMLNSGTCYAQDPISLSQQQTSAIEELNFWRRVNSAPTPSTLSDIKHLYHASPTVDSTIGMHGAFVTKFVIRNASNAGKLWFVNLHANYLDQGLAYWQSTTNDVVDQANFSQRSTANPKLAHAQVFPLFIESGDTVELWIYIEAKRFAVPVTVRLIPESKFYYQQFKDNILTAISIAVMLTLAVIAVFTYVRTRQMIILACAGYVGLHGLGWFAASGQLGYLFNISAINPAYAGILIFPFAIAAASLFTKMLFNCPQDYLRLSRFLHGVSITSVALGILMWVLPFASSYLISHIIAAFWIPISVSIGFFMLGKSDFRAKYYLAGNLTYGLALGYYVLSHTKQVNGDLLPELVVLLALTVDCICILLSLSEWIHIQQKEYYRSYTLSRIDPLTNVGNRHLFSERLSKLSSPYYLTFIDFDGFKQLNDTLGHEQGDRFLIESADIMQRKLKGIGEVFRTGGDEFIWLIVRKQNDKNLLTKISQLIAQTEQELMQAGWQQASLSYGIANSHESDNLSECLSLADKRMYEQKRSKKEVTSAAL
ncbi:diguanylate cyclase [Amphritea atlantica]|uniref:diguanylate cyclase n=1 Tax=Amphritea atlantica TaxID=355243 RepID=A0ABY5GXZ2_9GAMM|nr:diguanylate cyclase [Amphritea atlantica]